MTDTPPPLTLDQALQQAVASHRAGQLADAERLYRAILETQPRHPDANHNLGVLAMSVNQAAAALPLFKTALEANPSQGQYWLSYIDALIHAGQHQAARQLLLTAREKGLPEAEVGRRLAALPTEPAAFSCPAALALREAGQYREAAAALHAWLGEHPNDGEAWGHLAHTLLLDQQEEPARAALDRALAIAPQHPVTLRNHARLLLKQQQPEAARQAAQAAHQGDSQNPESWLVLAAALTACGQADQASALLEQTIAARPDYAEAYASRAVLRLRSNDPAGALADAETALAAKPQLGQLWNLVASLRHQFNNLPGTIEALHKALSFEPDNVGILVNLGELLRQTGQTTPAIELLEKAATLAPGNAAAWTNLGAALQDARNLEQAVRAYGKALQIAPQSAGIANNLGLLAKEDGHWEEALRYFDRALTINAQYAEACCNRGTVLQAQDRLEEAAASYRQALLINPHYTDAHINLGGALRELGQFPAALDSFNRALDLAPNQPAALMGKMATFLADSRHPEALAFLRQTIASLPEGTASRFALQIAITTLMPFGRSGSLFFHALFDSHPQITTLPGIYFKGWFGHAVWERFAPAKGDPHWRQKLVERIVQEFEPLLDARSTRNVPGNPIPAARHLAKASGFMEMGPDRDTPFRIDREAFSGALLGLLQGMESVSQSDCFWLIHQAFDQAVGRTEKRQHCFYHIHNPDMFEFANFIRHFPHARQLYIVRQPVQSLESWMLTSLEGYFTSADDRPSDAGQEGGHHLAVAWLGAVKKIAAMLFEMQSPFHALTESRGVRLEDVKREASRSMPRIAAWLGVADDPALYDASFCGLQYWGPTSNTTGKITGFDTKAIDRPVGRLFGERDRIIFETLFWPFSRLYGYTSWEEPEFRRKLAEIRPWLDEPLQFEQAMFEKMPADRPAIDQLSPYSLLHRLLKSNWTTLDRSGTYPCLLEPLKIN